MDNLHDRTSVIYCRQSHAAFAMFMQNLSKLSVNYYSVIMESVGVDILRIINIIIIKAFIIQG